MLHMLYTCYTSVKILRSTPDDNVYHFKRTNFNIINNALNSIYLLGLPHTVGIPINSYVFPSICFFDKKL